MCVCVCVWFVCVCGVNRVAALRVAIPAAHQQFCSHVIRNVKDSTFVEFVPVLLKVGSAGDVWLYA